MKDKIRLVGWIFIFVVCIGILFLGIRFIMVKDQHTEELMELPNPLTEVKSADEMRLYLGYNVPVILDKDVDKYIVIGNDKYANHGRIIYKDKSQFDIEKDIDDPSGIYGGVKAKEESISGINIELYTYEDTSYAIWKYNDYAYSYSMINSDENNLNIEVNKIIKIIR
ncbi:MAG: hypothetical protein IJI58_04565 [Bacilli bacterium]|nr:hypothetical protein [Bacilli bacterium]